MVVYYSAVDYIECSTDIQARIVRIRAIIAALETAALTAAASGGISEYMLDDGQTKISQVYRNGADIARSIAAFEAILQRAINQGMGRMVRLSDESNFKGRF